MRKLSKWMVCLMTAVMAATAVPAPVTPGGVTAWAAATPYDGDIAISEYDSQFIEVRKTPSGKIGGKISMPIVIKNADDYQTDILERVTVYIGGSSYNDEMDVDDSDDEDDDEDEDEKIVYHTFPFETDASLRVGKTVENVKTEKTVTLSARLRRDLAEGYYQVPLVIRIGEGRERVFHFYIWVSASKADDEEEETDQNFEFTLGEGQDTPFGIYPSVMDFAINLRNSGVQKAYDVRMEMQLSEDVTKFPFEISVGNYDYKLGDIDVDQVVAVPYSMALREDINTGYYPIKFNIRYREDSTADLSEPIEEIFYVRVQGKDEDELAADANENERTKARIIVDGYETIPETVYAGQAFTLKVRMKNASSNIQASNIMLTFAPEEVESSPVFTTKNGSSSTVINNLAPGQVSEVVMDFESGATVAQRSYSMTIKEQYDSPEFKNASEEVKIAIPVKQVARFNMGTIEVMPESIEVGNETNVMFDINNTGKVLLYNVMARFEADSIEPAEAYVGNVEPGKTGNVDVLIRGKAPTMDDGKVKIIISYEDENGLITETEKELGLYVTESIPEDFMDMEAGSMEVEEEPSFFEKNKILLAAAAVIVAGGAAFGIVRHRKKKKAEEAEDLDDEIS